MDSNLKREIILDNYSNPFNKTTEGIEGYIKVNSNNESCIDNIDLYIKIEDDIITDLKFDGEACAISTSASSIMIKSLIGKDVESAKKILENDNLLDIEYRYKHVIVISGSTQIGNGWGNATYGNNYDGIDVANKALNISYELKNTYNCFIDVVGLHMNSTTSYPPPEPNWNDGVRDDYLKTNAFLCYLSSNYPDATSVTNPGSFKQTYNFYKNYVSFTNENYYNFTNYFQNELYYRENARVCINKDTVIRDVIDSSFKLIEGTTSDDIKVYLADVDYSTGTFGEKYLLEDDHHLINTSGI